MKATSDEALAKLCSNISKFKKKRTMLERSIGLSGCSGYLGTFLDPFLFPEPPPTPPWRQLMDFFKEPDERGVVDRPEVGL